MLDDMLEPSGPPRPWFQHILVKAFGEDALPAKDGITAKAPRHDDCLTGRPATGRSRRRRWYRLRTRSEIRPHLGHALILLAWRTVIRMPSLSKTALSTTNPRGTSSAEARSLGCMAMIPSKPMPDNDQTASRKSQSHYCKRFYNQPLKITPAMAAGVTSKLWEMSDMVKVLEEREAICA